MAKRKSPAAAPSPANKAAATPKNRLRLREDSLLAEKKQVHMKHLRAPSVKYDALFLKETKEGKKLRLYERRQRKFESKENREYQENAAKLAAVKDKYQKIKEQKKKVRKDLVLVLKAYKIKFRETVDRKVTSVDMLMVLRKLIEWVNFKPKWTISEVRRSNGNQSGPIQVMQQLLQLPNCISTLQGCTTATPAFSTRMSASASASALASASASASASAATDAPD